MATSQKKGRFSKLVAVSRFAEPAAFDSVKAERFMRCALSMVASAYPDGALEWLEKHRPDIKSVLGQAEEAVDAAILAEDFDAFCKRLNKWSEAHFRAFDVFKLRPPVIDVNA